MTVRLVAIDIDGTLLDGRGRVPPANAAAIDEALDAGIHVVLVTGRSYPFARTIATELPPAVTLIVSNGAIERSADGTTFARRLLPREAARRVLHASRAHREQSALLFDRETADHVVAENMNWAHPQRRGYWERHQHLIGHASPLEDALTDEPIQVMFNGGVAAMRAVFECVSTLDDVSVTRTEYVRRDFALVDVTSATATKGLALASRARALGLERHEVMAIGDNLNDLEMLEFAGIPVVMGNAVDELRGRGWHQTAGHDEAGVALAIRRLALDGVPNGSPPAC